MMLSGGHLSYILEIYENNRLPDTNGSQFYHPPLHHIIGAMWLKVVDVFIQDESMLYESLQCLTLLYSVLFIVVSYKILKELKVKRKYQYIILYFIALHPTLIILSGSINNDMLSILLILYVMYRLIKWYHNQSIKNTISLAIFTGLAVMAKTSGAIVSVPIIYVFLLQFYRALKKSCQKKQTLLHYIKIFLIFGVLSLSIGLWFPIRNYILFGQPILYVLNPNNAELYVGNHSLFSRLFPISKEFLEIYAHPYENYNIPVYLLKTSLFGEYEWSYEGILYKSLYWLAMISAIILAVFSIVGIIEAIITKSKRNIVENRAFIILGITNIASYIIMNINLPYGCSMDFRYIVSTIFIEIYFIIHYLNSIKNLKFKRRLENTIMLCVIIMVISSNCLIMS